MYAKYCKNSVINDKRAQATASLNVTAWVLFSAVTVVNSDGSVSITIPCSVPVGDSVFVPFSD